MNREYAERIIDSLRLSEDVALSSFRAEREYMNGKQEGYQEAMSRARQIINDYIVEVEQ